jgi:rRNA processing protein Krr1/Pno1
MERIKVPSSAIAHIIGRGGANIKNIQNRSGTKCRVQGDYVEVTGSPDAQRLAFNLIQDCIDNSIAVYNHPLEAIIALRQPLVKLKSVKFVKYQGIVDEYNINKAYFVLDKGEEIDHNDISSSLRSLNIRYEMIIFHCQKFLMSVH